MEERWCVPRLPACTSGLPRTRKLATGSSDGSISSYNLTDDALEPVKTWKEPRLRADKKFIGISLTERCVSKKDYQLHS